MASQEEKLVDLIEREENPTLFNEFTQMQAAEGTMKSYLEEAARFEEQFKAHRLKYEELRKAADEKKGDIVAKAKHTYELLMRHAGVAAVEVQDDGYLLIRTKLLFTKIREKDGARGGKRACIGAFNIYISPQRQSIRIENVLFQVNAYPHWSVNTSGNPCWGEWEGDIRTLMQKRDYYSIVDMLYYYLLSTEDSAAYTRSHHWRDGRGISALEPEAEKFRKGDYVIVTAVDCEGKALQGMVGKIICSCGNNVFSIEFKESIGSRGHSGEDGTGKEGYCWNIFYRDLAKISKEMYEAKTKFKFDERLTPAQEVLAALDELEIGSKVEDAKECARSAYQKSIRLEMADVMAA